MAVAQTGAIFKALTVDGESSRTYGVYITGQAVYNAPQREVEMISIAGRNGKFALDKGRFENIEVTYPAGIYADTEEDFAEAISDFRNYLCSRDGYVRIEDEYNPNEYRMGVYKSGLEVTPKLLKAGEFDITFDCKPQRWLKSGENAITVESGDAVTNPTLFESSPLLITEGYGDIDVAGNIITLEGLPLGRIKVASPVTSKGVVTWEIDPTLVNTGDNLTAGGSAVAELTYGDSFTIMGAPVVSAPTDVFPNATISAQVTGERTLRVEYSTGAVTEGYGSEGVFADAMFTCEFPMKYGDAILSAAYDIRVIFESSSNAWKMTTPVSMLITPTKSQFVRTNQDLYADSTVIALEHTTYIDLDIGEAWEENGSTVIPLNNIVQLPSDLPKLSSGANTITFDNTITDLKIVPRWWKV